MRYLLRSWELYVFVLPAIIHVLLFRYLPIYGLRIAFTDGFSLRSGRSAPEWNEFAPNLDRIFAEKPEALSDMLNPQGQMQALARFHFLESNYLEQNYMINRRWLDALGLNAPTTTGELRDVLIAFRDGDPNGNGKADEIPFAFVTNDGFAQHLRSMYGIWGMPTKNGIAIRDGQAYFAPITQGYRDMITYLADLYSEGPDRSGELHHEFERLQRQGGRSRRQHLRLCGRAARPSRPSTRRPPTAASSSRSRRCGRRATSRRCGCIRAGWRSRTCGS